MRKKLFLLSLAAFLITASAFAQQRAKYVFYFIGDGMGVNQVTGTETFYAALAGRIGVSPLCFTAFPNSGFVTTYSATNGVTDSAAGGTALATGQKTKNGVLGMLPDAATPVNSVAVWAQQSGNAVGIAKSVSVDHATPAAFYAHVPDRNMSYAIGQQLIAPGFDFYAGSDFLQPVRHKDDSLPSLYEQCASAGYTLVRGYKECQKKIRKAERMILLQTEAASKRDRKSVPYAIDRAKGDLTLSEITRAGIRFLSEKQKEGFFFMVEGGKIDWACHDNDAATTFREVKDFDDAIRVAYEFYEQHPDETLIVVTADHETGGIALGTGAYLMHTHLLRGQRVSADAYAKELDRLRLTLGDKFTWEVAKASLTEHFGFWTDVPLKPQHEERLRKAFDEIRQGIESGEENLYGKQSALAARAKRIINELALVGWQSGGHSNGIVPVFAIGAGAELFHGKMENTDIPLCIARAAGYRHD